MIEESFLHQEIYEQPAVLARFLEEGRDSTTRLAEEILRRDISHVVIAARGTSDNAGRYAQYVLGSLNGLVVALATPSLFSVYKRPPTFGKALVLGISQSGGSPDIIAVLAEAQRQGALTAVMTNDPFSDLAAHGDHVIDICAGPEKAVAATKSYTAELAAVALLSAVLRDDVAHYEELQALPDAVSATLSMEEEIAQVAPRYRYMQYAMVIGRGYNYATAFELSLKLEELTYAIVEPYSSADFLHGPLAVIDRGFPVMVIVPSGAMTEGARALIGTLNEWGAEVIAISDDDETLKLARIPLALPRPVAEWLSPITAIVPGQLFALHLAHTRDFDVDAPRGLKKVTKTS